MECSSDCFWNNFLTKEGERPKSKRLGSHLEQIDTRQCLVDETATMAGRSRIFWRQLTTKARPHERALHLAFEWCNQGIQPWIEKIIESCPVVGCKDDVATWLCNASHLSYGQFWLLEPGNES